MHGVQEQAQPVGGVRGRQCGPFAGRLAGRAGGELLGAGEVAVLGVEMLAWASPFYTNQRFAIY